MARFEEVIDDNVDASADGNSNSSVSFDTTDDAADAFLKKAKDDAKKPASDADPEGDETVTTAEDQAEADDDPKDPVEGEDADEGDDDAEGDEDDGKEPIVADPEAVVEVKVGDQTLKMKVKDLTRLAGQEQALTQKSMEVAEKRKRSEAAYAVADKTYTALIEDAKKAFEPYRKLDVVKLAQSLPPADFAKVEKAAKAAAARLQWFQTSAEAFAQEHEAEIRAQREAEAAEAVEYVRKAIPDWDKPKWTALRDFATSRGLQPDEFDNLTHGPALVLLYEAQQYNLAKKKAKETPVTKKTAKSPKDAPSPQRGRRSVGDDTKATFARLRETGDMEDAASAFEARSALRRARARAND